MTDTAVALGRTPDPDNHRSKFTPERRAQIAADMRLGMFAKHAAWAAGIHPQTLHLWFAKGITQGEGPYAEFVEECGMQLGGFVRERLQELTEEARSGDWRASLELLKRRMPEQGLGKVRSWLDSR